MLVNELKNEIKKYNKNDLEKIIVELYKRMPKAKKEEYDIDDFIKNIDNNKVVKKELDFDSLQKEISYFLECVDAGLYCSPNKIISKKERSSWRFKVKRYYKELIKILPNVDNGGMATFLLIELFKRLSTGSNTLLFVNWDTFKALGVSQYNYYDIIVKRVLYNGYTIDSLKTCINLLSVEKDPYGFSYNMFEIFLNNLKTHFNKEDSIALINDKIIELKKNFKDKNTYDSFYLTELINDYVKLNLHNLVSVNEIRKGIDFFQANYIEDYKEEKEYILLSKLEEFNLITEWIYKYEKNANKINFSDSLKEKYHKFKSINGSDI